MGNDGLIAYLEWGAVHPEPKFSQFFLKAGYVDGPVTGDRNVKGGELMVVTDPAYVRPSLADASRLLGPVAADTLTLVAQPLQGATLRLVAVAR